MLEAGRPVETAALREAMTASFGGTDAEGIWDWKTAYDVCEAAEILFLRRYGAAIISRAAPSALAMIERIAALFPTHTRRSESAQALQQFSTPPGLAFVAATAASAHSGDRVLEPSAGTGMLAVHAALSGADLALNELAEVRAVLLSLLFPEIAVSRHDAATIDDRLPETVRPTVVLMNPPFSAVAHVDQKIKDAALRHIASALARLELGGRLVAITGANCSPDVPAWRDAFVAIQETGRIVFTAAIAGNVYAKHGTSIENATDGHRQAARRRSGDLPGQRRSCAGHGNAAPLGPDPGAAASPHHARSGDRLADRGRARASAMDGDCSAHRHAGFRSRCRCARTHL